MIRRATILIIEDSPGSLAMAADVLARQEFQVRVVEGVERALATLGDFHPDLILLDSPREGEAGAEILSLFRGHERAMHIPLILVGMPIQGEGWVEELRRVVDDFLPGPYHPEEVLARVRILLSLSRVKEDLESRTIALRQSEERLRTEIAGRNRMEEDLLASLGRAERSRQTMLSILEDQKRAEEQSRRHARQQAAIAELGQLALKGVPLQELMDRVVNRAAQELDVEYCKVLELLPDRTALLLRAGTGWREGLVGTALVPNDLGSQAGYTLVRREPVVVSDLPAEERFAGNQLLHDHGVISGMSVIIGDPGRPYGLIGTHSVRQKDFSSHDVHFLQGVAHLLANAVQHRIHEADIERMNHLYATLSHVNQTIVHSRSREELFGQLCRDAVEYGRFLMAGIGFREMDGAALEPVAIHSRIESGTFDSSRVGGACDLASEALLTGIPCLSSDSRREGGSHPCLDALVGAGLRSCAAFPFRWQGEIRGVFCLCSEETDFFNVDEIGLLQEVTEDISFALEHLDQEERRRKAESALRESERRLAITIDAARLGIFDWDPSTDRLIGNGRLAELMELGREEFDGAFPDFVRQIHPGDRPAMRQAVIRCRQDRTMFHKEFRVDLPHGEIRWIDASGCFLHDEATGSLGHMCGVLADITERKEMESALKKSEEMYRFLVENQGEGVGRVDGNEEFVFANPAGEEIFGVPPGGLVGRNLADFLDLEQLKVVQGQTADRMKGVKGHYELKINAQDGVDRWIMLTATPENDRNGRYRGAVAIFRDISERKRADEELRLHREHLEELVQERTNALQAINRELEAEVSMRRRTEVLLEKARDEAESANRAKSTFLSSMSHEIRTPMNAILGFSQLLARDQGLSARQREQLDTIVRSGEHLLAIINEILEFSRIEAGRAVLNMETFDLFTLLGDVERMFRVKTEARGLEFRVEPDEDVQRVLVADPGKLRQILINLLGNAVKFTEKGGIFVRVRMERRDSGKTMLILEVQDTGSGISGPDQARLFQVFSQTEEGVRKGGTGLGLALSRHLARLLGGDITVRSEVGTGSLFTASMEVGVDEGVEPSVSHSGRRVVRLLPGQEPIRLMVVDDAPDNRNLLRELLSVMGFEIREAEDGRKAVDLFQEWPPHAILMDLQMPVMDGVEAIRSIREMEGGGAVSIIAISASVQENDRRRALESGADGFIRKPFRMEELCECLQALLGVKYKYADEEMEETGGGEPPLGDIVLAVPDELRERLVQATVSLDRDALLELLDQVEGYGSDVAAKMRHLVKNYQYDSLMEILRGGS